MPTDIDRIKHTWRNRQRDLGNTKRSVMLKNLPSFLNNSIHKKHIHYILKGITRHNAAVLDVGCGWGRISSDLLKIHPCLDIEGVELDKEFSNHFSKTVGPCFTDPVQDFKPQKQYDTILFVTSLMYLQTDELLAVINTMWQALNRGGKFICIEPSTNAITSIINKIKVNKLSPTGKNVAYFKPGELSNTFTHLPQADVSIETNIGFLPFLSLPAVHKAVTISKS